MKFVDVKNNIDDEGLKEAYTDAFKDFVLMCSFRMTRF